MSNLALYRKYRSAGFDEVVGQQHIVKTLSNAIKSGKHSHAYLLTGPRGVGKTTIARIIAKDINGLGKDEELANYLDIIEIDGASNRGIDEIRSLREKVQVAPAKLEYKVYIIDEVHMLTKEAFNALLKTLEEPPAHVVFIFATTDAHKLPDTIISRTQRFDFRPIAKSDMIGHLRVIADKEGIAISDDALELIAQLSNGGFRDAIGLLDQVSVSDGEIGVDTISEFTGLQDSDAIKNLFTLASQDKTKEVCVAVQALMDLGADPGLLLVQMLDYLQQNLIIDSGFKHEFLIDLADNLHWAQSNIKYSSSPALVIQVALSKKPIQFASQQSAARAVARAKNNEVAKPSAPPVKNVEPVDSEQPVNSKDTEALLIKALSIIKNYNNSLYAVLKGSDIRINEDEIRVGCRFSFHKDRISESKNSSLIEKAFSKVYGRNMQLVADVESRQRVEKVSPEEELVSTAAAIFGAEVTDG